jgi:hypothetical protein
LIKKLTAFLAVCQRHQHPSAPDGTGRYRSAQTDTDRHRPAPTGTDRHKTGTDRSGLFYDVFDKNFQNIIPF